MIKKQFLNFLLRWLISSLVMFVCLRLFATFGPGAEYLEYSVWFYAVAGLVFALVNIIVKPLATILSLSLIFATYGLFTFIVNVLMVVVTVWLIPNVSMDFWGAFYSCITISVINFLVNIIESRVK